MKSKAARQARAVLFGLLLALAPVGAAEDAEPTSVFGDRIDVRVINLEVVVTDREGERVSGLQAGDFELLVDWVSFRAVPTGCLSQENQPTRTATGTDSD